MAYLNVEEIEAALNALAASYPGAAELVALPNRTSEGRQSHALRVGPADERAGNAAVVTGGLHARECSRTRRSSARRGASACARRR